MPTEKPRFGGITRFFAGKVAQKKDERPTSLPTEPLGAHDGKDRPREDHTPVVLTDAMLAERKAFSDAHIEYYSMVAGFLRDLGAAGGGRESRLYKACQQYQQAWGALVSVDLNDKHWDTHAETAYDAFKTLQSAVTHDGTDHQKTALDKLKASTLPTPAGANSKPSGHRPG